MYDIYTVFNIVACSVLAGALGWAVLSHRVRDGIVIKLGLICMALGEGVLAWHLVDGLVCSDLRATNNAQALVHLGLALVLVGYLRHLRAGRGVRDILSILE